MGSEMGPLSSPGMTSCRLPIVTIGLSHQFRSAPDVPDGQNWSSNRRHYALKGTGCQKCSVFLLISALYAITATNIKSAGMLK